MKKLLLTGASGFLGWNICNHPQDRWKITGTTFTNSLELPGVDLVNIDLTDEDAVIDLFRKLEPDGVIHTAANRNPNYCEDHPEETNVINIETPIFIAQLCASRSIPFVFTSTDLVFNGEKGNYSENDLVDPINHYGAQKVMAEEGIKSVHPEAAICRMPLMFGDPGPVGTSFIQFFLDKMKAGEELGLFEDEYRSALGGQSAAVGLLHALENFKGIYHMGGLENLSRYDFGLLLKEAFNIPEANLEKIRQRDIRMAAPRPADVSLNSEKAYAAGFKPLPAKEELSRLV